MSAINLIVANDTAYLYTDGLFYEPDGTVAMMGQKVYPVAHLPAVFAVRAPQAVGPLLLHRLMCMPTFDGLVAHLGVAAQGVRRIYEDLSDCPPELREFEVVAAGFSEASGQIEVHVVTTHDRYAEDGILPFRPQLWQGSLIGPGLPPEEGARLEDEFARDGFDVERHGFRIMSAQRDRPHASMSGMPIHGVGGHCQLTRLGRDGIAMKVIGRWPDTIGKPVDLALAA